LDNGNVIKYNFGSNQLINLGTISDGVTDIAYKNNKLWTYFGLQLREYNVTFEPPSINLNRLIIVTDPGSIGTAAGLDYKDPNKILVGGGGVFELDITTNTTTSNLVFSIPGSIITGDILYIDTNNLLYSDTYLLTYNDSPNTLGVYRLGLFNSSGTLLKTTILPFNNAFGLFKTVNGFYLIRSSGEIYLINVADLSLQFVKNLFADLPAATVNGAASI
jgi:hypothetical protein